MLILTRRPGQNIKLRLEDGREITISLLGINNGEWNRLAKIGIDAPKTINIVREELLAYDEVVEEFFLIDEK